MKNLLKKYQYVIGISIIVLFQFIYEFGWSIDPYLYVNYFMDYSMGFGPRKLIGTLCQLMLPDGLSNEKNILILITLVYVVLAGLVIFIANKFIRILSLSEKRLFLFAILFVALYFLSPARIEYLFVHTNYGRMDTYMLIFAIVFIMSIRIKSWAFYTLSTILMILSCLSHQIFVCTFLPLYCASYVYRIFNEKDWRKELFYSMLSMFVLTCLFCYVQFFPINTYDLNATMQIINERTGKEFDEFIIFYEYYANIKTHFNCLMLSQINRLVIGFIASIVVLMPLFLIFIYLWCTAVRIANDKKYKITIILMNLSFLLCVPAFIFTMDYGRWFAAIIICP